MREPCHMALRVTTREARLWYMRVEQKRRIPLAVTIVADTYNWVQVGLEMHAGEDGFSRT